MLEGSSNISEFQKFEKIMNESFCQTTKCILVNSSLYKYNKYIKKEVGVMGGKLHKKDSFITWW